MGLIYVSSESSDFMSALKSNLESGKETVSQLKSGSQKVISAVDGKQLSGAAYTAGKGLFADLIIPTITRTTNAIEQIEQELKKYQNADKIVASEGELDETKLNQQVQVTRTMKNSLDQILFYVQLQTRLNPIASVLDTLLNVERDLQRMTDSFQEDIDHLQNQLRKLQDFNTQTSGLFANSLDELELAMQGVLILNNTTIKSDGSYALPKGTNKSYFEKIKKDVFLVLESGDQEIELIKETDSLEEINRKTLACASIGINPYTGKKISQEEANKFKYAAWSGTLTNIGDTVMGAYYGNKGASRLDGMDDVGSVKKKSLSESNGGNVSKTDFGAESPVFGKDWNDFFKDKYGNIKWKNPLNSIDDVINTPSSLTNVNPIDIVEFVKKEGWTVTPLKKGGNAGIPYEQGGGFSMNPPAGTSGSSRYIQYHPGGGHHGDLPYYKVSSPEHGITRIYMNGKVVREWLNP
ncbi:T7SS effector LXG polymorphic toxin [Enterococcus mundtii]|uniref:T7SS effector LXG polymorphic toxin n=1 Tax=Enterococcus mundtii TaxID=53346 RepID=UPI003007E13E